MANRNVKTIARSHHFYGVAKQNVEAPLDIQNIIMHKVISQLIGLEKM